MFGLSASQLLSLTVLAAVVTTVGNLLATFLKEAIFVRSFERWKERRTLMALYRKYRDPILLSGQELLARLSQVCKDYPPDYLRSDVLSESPSMLETNSSDDPYFKKYRFLSSVYRLCAFLGWLELYRQDVTFLSTGKQSQDSKLADAISLFRGVLADGQLNQAEDWSEWRDRLIFREEQRAIGEVMIVSGTSPRVVLGYGMFCSQFRRAGSEENLWPLQVASNFLSDLEEKKDFRRERLEKLRLSLESVHKLLQEQPV